MKLTPREAKMLSNMRKQQAQWPKVRWFQIIIGLGTMIAFLHFLGRLFDFLKEDTMFGLVAFTLIIPIIFLWILIGGYKTGQAIIDWHGNPERTLLLKLFDEIERRE